MPLTPPTSDPFTTVAKSILSTLKAWPAWNAIVKDGNVIDMTIENFQKWLTNISTADVPRAVMVQNRYKRFPLCSLASGWTQDYTFFCPFDTLVSSRMNQFKDATYDALVSGDRLFGLAGQNIVRGWSFADGLDDAFGQLKWKSQQDRWVHVFTLHVEGYKAYS